MEETKPNTAAPGSAPFWSSPAVFAEHFLAPFYKTETVGSFGKLWSSILMLACLVWWLRLKRDIPASMESMVWAMLAYTFSTKGVQIVRNKINGKSNVTSVATGNQSGDQAAPSKGSTTPAAVEDEG